MAPVAEVVARRGDGRLGHIRLVGRIEGGTGVPSRALRSYPSYALTYVTAGNGRYRDAAHDVPVTPGTLILVFPRMPHWYGTAGGATWDETFLVFGGPLFELAHRTGVVDPGRPLHTALPVTRWKARLEDFGRRPRAGSRAAADREALELMALIAEATGTADGRADRGAVDWFARSVDILEGDLETQVAMPEIARAVGMPYETWRRAFRTRAGSSPQQYRNQHRLKTAVELLEHTRMSTREIAAALGFTDERHLIRRFRARHRMTPRQFRDNRHR
ncbi:helix-turn-helix domain-containing protein [Micromonospora sp. BQ11]|uniref:helix-turn-helix domain-containing protein n=1 Tax=Micromonospora sp. BQ11 TaxID=3452212 RepID=UPI003F8C3416